MKVNNKLIMIVIFFVSGCVHQTAQTWEQKVSRAVEEHTPQAEARLRPYFEKANIPYPPSQITWIAFKKEKQLELWAKKNSAWFFVKRYPILAASGYSGPKLAEGDGQVPEGQYSILEFNPESKFHLSLLLDYPNKFDQKRALIDGRHQLGNEIYIHGGNVSKGCLAVGNKSIEEVFVLTYKVGRQNALVLIAPNDLRTSAALKSRTQPYWAEVFYRNLKQRLENYPPGDHNQV